MVLLEFRYPVMTRRGLQEEALRVVDAGHRTISSARVDGVRVITVDLRTLREDVRRSESGELLASKLLTPFTSNGDREALQSLLLEYGLRVVREVVEDLLRDFRGMAHRLLFGPEYVVTRKVGALTSIYPPLMRAFWWASGEHKNDSALRKVALGLQPVIERAVESGLLSVDETTGALRIPAARTATQHVSAGRLVKSLTNRLQTFLKAGGVGFSLLRIVLEELTEGGWEGIGARDPESMLRVMTELGPAPVDDDSDVIDLISKSMRVDRSRIRVLRVGRAFNSTYLIEVDLDGGQRSLFLKKFLAWNSVKWVATKLWAFPLRNFHISPSMRLSNELFFTDLLRERGIPTPRVVHVSWRRKVLVRQAIRGRSVMDLWTSSGFSDSEAEKAVNHCGRLIASVHGEGVVVGDCKADNVVIDENGRLWLIDLEQASTSGDKSWDVAEFVLFAGRYLDPSRAELFAESFARGYLEVGDEQVVRGALDPRYVLVMMPWTPIWTQMAMTDGIRRALKT